MAKINTEEDMCKKIIDISVLFVICVFLAAIPATGKVLELSERFIPLRNEGMWLIKVWYSSITFVLN